MLYMGHFSFVDSPQLEDGTSIGAFQCVAEADDMDAALEKFKDIIVDLHTRGELFHEVNDIYLESCVEIRHIPAAGMLTHFQEWTIQCSRVGSISTDLPGVAKDCAAAYCCGPQEGFDDEEYEAEPFVTF